MQSSKTQHTLDNIIVRSITAAMYFRHNNAFRLYEHSLGVEPNLCPPTTSNEKHLWRKIFDHNPFFQLCCNKLASKEWVKQQCPNLQIPEVLWHGKSAKDIPDEFFNTPCYIKANAGSYQNIKVSEEGICRADVEQKFNEWLAKPYGVHLAEWAYQHPHRTLYVEKIIEPANKEPLIKISVQCIGGKPSFASWIIGSHTAQVSGALLRSDGSRLNTRAHHHRPLPEDYKPAAVLKTAFDYAAVLAKNTDFLRCDFLYDGKTLWFGEFTVYHLAGLGKFIPQDEGEKLYTDWDLTHSWLLKTPQKGWRRVYANALRRLIKKQAAQHETQPVKPGSH